MVKLMKTEVAVLYGDLSIQRVAWEDRHSLRRDGVLAIVVLHAGENKRRQSSILHDWYQLIWTDTDCCLTGHDGEYGFYSLTDLKADPEWRFPFILPENCIEFDSVYVDDPKEWKRALEIFSDPDGEMF